MHHSEPLFTILGLNVTAEVTTMWAIMLILVLLSILVTRRMTDVPGKLQNALEMAVEKLTGFYNDILGPERTEQYFPFLGTLFIFIIVCNYSGLIPGAGIVEGFKAPTSSLSVTAGIAVCAFVMTHYSGIRGNGLRGYARHFIQPVAIMLPFMLVDEIVRPVSLALRLFGNIFGEESVTEQLYNIFPIGAPILMMVMSLLFCALQAMVFSMLTAIYIEGASGHGH